MILQIRSTRHTGERQDFTLVGHEMDLLLSLFMAREFSLLLF